MKLCNSVKVPRISIAVAARAFFFLSLSFRRSKTILGETKWKYLTFGRKFLWETSPGPVISNVYARDGSKDMASIPVTSLVPTRRASAPYPEMSINSTKSSWMRYVTCRRNFAPFDLMDQGQLLKIRVVIMNFRQKTSWKRTFSEKKPEYSTARAVFGDFRNVTMLWRWKFCFRCLSLDILAVALHEIPR